MKIGLMVPQNNTTMERELVAWLGEGTSCQTLKIKREAGLMTRDSVPAYVAHALELAKTFQDPDTVVYGCTSAGFILGPQGDAALAKDLARTTGRRVVTTARSAVDVLKREKAGRVAVVTPYSEQVNRQLTQFLTACGINVARLETLNAKNVEELGRITSGQVAALARETMGPEYDALFIACTQLPTYDIVPQLRKEFARPVWSSNQAVAEAVAH